jgi:hypothetical protein
MIALPDFSIYCEAACIEYWGHPDKRNFKELRWGKPDGYSGRSFNIKKKRWYDRDAKRGGSTLTLIALEEGLTDQNGKPDVRGKRFFEAWRLGYQKKIIAEPPPEQRGGPKDIRAAFPYRDENGAHLYDVVRFNTDEVDERFRYRLPSGEWKLGKTRRVLYRLPELIAAIKASERVLVCEAKRTPTLLLSSAMPRPQIAAALVGGARPMTDSSKAPTLSSLPTMINTAADTNTPPKSPSICKKSRRTFASSCSRRRI